jgi:hypothetical protein
MHRRSVASAVVATAVAALFAACSSPSPVPPQPRQDPLASFRTDEFPGRDDLLRGFAPAAADGDRGWRTGDQVLFGLRLQSDGQMRRWLLRLTVTDTELPEADNGSDHGGPVPRLQRRSFDVHGRDIVEITSRLAAVRVEVADERGHPLGESRIEMPRDLLDKGFTAACQAMEAPANRVLRRNLEVLYATIDVRPYVEAMGALMALLDVVTEDPTLAPILWQVVQKPSLWSVLWHFGAAVSVQPRFHDAVRAVPLPAPFANSDAAWVVPITLTVNGAPALFCDVVVGSSVRPLALCGGIVGAEARHPTDTGLTFSFRLLAAQRAAAH